MTRDERILSMRGKKSFGVIAKELGVSRSAVSGVMFRARWPNAIRVPSKNGHPSRKNCCGVGPHGAGQYASKTLWDLRKEGPAGVHDTRRRPDFARENKSV